MKKLLALACVIVLIHSCSSSDGGSGTSSDSYNRTALLTHWADDIIMPAYLDFQTKTDAQAIAVDTFVENPNEANLENLRAAWLEAYKAFQHVSMYDLGKADETSFKEALNTYPASASGIEANIASGSYNLLALSAYPMQGFPGMDYLINGLETNDAAILATYSGENAAKYKAYLVAVATRIKSMTDVVVNDWDNGYRNSYVASAGTSVSSSVNKTTNLFVKNLEKDIRTGKIGIPAGIFSNNVPFAEKVEGFYKNDISRELYLTALKSQQDFFNGKSFGSQTTGLGLASYLDAVNAERDGQRLSNIINARFDAAITSGTALNASLSQQIVSNNAAMVSSFDVLQEVVVVVKLDMLQALNITIDYVDGDGD